MPLVAVIGGTYLCMHGGLSQELHDLDSVMELNRFDEIPKEGLFCDLMWADPVKDKHAQSKNFTRNNMRKCSVKFGLPPL